MRLPFAHVAPRRCCSMCAGHPHAGHLPRNGASHSNGHQPLTCCHTPRHPSSYAEIEAELRKLDREETKLISDMKQAAKNSPATAKVLAKQLVRLRQNRQRMQGSAAQITGMNAGLKTQQVRAGCEH